MAKVVNNFIKGRMNKDLDDRLIPIGEYRNALNAQVSKSEGENVGALENVLGNSLVGSFQFVTGVSLVDAGTGYATAVYTTIYDPLLKSGGSGVGLTVRYDPGAIIPVQIQTTGFGYEVGDRLVLDGGNGDAVIEVTSLSTMRSIGFYSDELNNKIYVFLTDNTQSTIYDKNAKNAIAYYDTVNDVVVLLAFGAFLNFSQLFPITGVNLLENLLFFTDNYNQPRRINVDTASSNSSFYNSEDLISVAKYNPYESIELFKLSSNLTAASPALAKYETTMYDVVSKFYPHGGSGNLLVNASIGDTVLRFDRETIVGQINSGGGSNNYGAGFGATVAIVNPSTQEMIPLLNAGGSQIVVDEVDYYDGTATGGPGCDVTLSDPIQVDITSELVVFNYNEYYVANYNGDVDFLKERFVRFAYRFKFIDGEYSIFSPFTQECFIPQQDGYFIYRVIKDREGPTGTPITTNNAVPQEKTDEEDTYRSTVVEFMENKVNRIILRIPLPYINSELSDKLQIESVDILYKESDGLNVNVIETVKIDTIVNSTATAQFDAYGASTSLLELSNFTGLIKPGQMVSGTGITNAPLVVNIAGFTVELSEPVPGLVAGTQLSFGDPNYFEYEYQAKKPYKVLPESELTRTYDKIPVKALSQEVISNRIVYGNFQTKHTPPDTLDYSVGISDKSQFSSGVGQAEVIGGPYAPGTTLITVDSGTVILPITQNSTVTGTGIDTDTTLVEYDTSASTVELDKSTTAIINNGDILTFTSQTSIANTTSIIEYPNSSLKQNRTYQVGVTLSDRFGRTSTVVLADREASVLLGNQEFKGSSVFSNYISTAEPANDWPGNSLKVLFNSVIGPDAANPGTLWPGLYKGDPNLDDYNPLGWYSFKVVVKQTEQEYYNVYLPGIMAGYPIDTERESGKTSHFVLINDNINKVPRDLNEVGPLQTQFRSSVRLFGRVQNNCGFDVDDWNEQFYPVGETPIVSTIGTERELFDSAREVGYQGNGEFYDVRSNPLIARLSTPSQEIGCPATIVTCQVANLPSPPFATAGTVILAEGSFAAPDTYWIGLDVSSVLPNFGTGTIADLNAVIISGQTVTANDGITPPVIVQRVGQDSGNYYVQVYAPQNRPTLNVGETLTFSPTPKYRGNSTSLTAQVVYSMPQLAVMETEPVESLLDIFWETSTTGLIEDLNTAILNDTAGTVTIDGFATAPFTEAIGNDSFISSNFVLKDTLGVTIPYVATNPPLLELVSVIDGNGTDRSANFQTGVLTPVVGSEFNVKTAAATALDPTAGQFVFEGNDPAPRTFAFTFNINYAPGGSAPVALQIIKNGIVLGNETPVAAPGKPFPTGTTLWIPGDDTNIEILYASNGSTKIGSQALGMDWELNAIGSDGNNYGPTGFEVTGSGAPIGNNTFTISTGTGLGVSTCSITFNPSAFLTILNGGGTVPNPISFKARAIDDGGEFVEANWQYEFDFNSCRTWIITYPADVVPTTYQVNTFECAGAYNVCSPLILNLQSPGTGVVTQENFCSKANCADPTFVPGTPGGASISKNQTPGINPCLPTP